MKQASVSSTDHGGGSVGALARQAFDAFERQHEPKRHTDFEQVSVSVCRLGKLGRDVAPRGPLAILCWQVFFDQIPHVGEGLELHYCRDR